ncbi:hypothetical protein LTS10_011651 [Elasticomyces elasticus]|nr:hypothetical protein LTS10_011651 [Elasticomyces elasticus]
MSRTVTVDIPIGEHTAKCTIKLPTAAAAAVGHNVVIATITNEITASLQQLTTFPKEKLEDIERSIQSQRDLAAKHETMVRIKIEAQAPLKYRHHGKDSMCCYTVGRHEILGTVLRAYAKFMGEDVEKLRFYFMNERFDGNYSSAADLKMEGGDTIEAR